MMKFVFDSVENIVGKVENAGYQHFLLFQQCFQKNIKTLDFVGRASTNNASFFSFSELQNEGAKEKCMLELLHSLPDANYYTIVYMIEHLVRVAKQSLENKMSISNLSTIFGPTLLTPAVKEGSSDPMVQMARAAKDATVQSEVINFFLKLASSGKNIRKSAAND